MATNRVKLSEYLENHVVRYSGDRIRPSFQLVIPEKKWVNQLSD